MWTAIDLSVLYKVNMSSATATSLFEMASTDVESEDSFLLKESVIRGHHVFKFFVLAKKQEILMTDVQWLSLKLTEL